MLYCVVCCSVLQREIGWHDSLMCDRYVWHDSLIRDRYPYYQHNAYQWVMSHVSMTYLSHKYVFTDTFDLTHWYVGSIPLCINVWHGSLMGDRHVWHDSLVLDEYLNLLTQGISMSHGTRIYAFRNMQGNLGLANVCVVLLMYVTYSHSMCTRLISKTRKATWVWQTPSSTTVLCGILGVRMTCWHVWCIPILGEPDRLWKRRRQLGSGKCPLRPPLHEAPHLTAAGVLQCTAVCYSVLQCVAVCCGVLQCVAVCWSIHVAARSHRLDRDSPHS